ncbi:MAG: orotidine-5'-phosphate decarboxylase [Actinomycetota bacterium]|nr:orotidine-5'-phosphate decarboxylase [Actinomycetota bacterium]
MTVSFHDQLARSWKSSGSMLCIGLDPDPQRYPSKIAGTTAPAYEFCSAIVEATADLVCAFKPQIAHFAAQSAEDQLERLCRKIREDHPDVTLILDAKRGDISSTATFYADEAFGRYVAHAVTVNPYLGTDAAAPFLARGGVIALCRTSNDGAGELQDLVVGGRPLYVRVAEMVAERWTEHGECGLVAGATASGELADIRAVAGELPVLVPGVGVQGGDLEASMAAGATLDGLGLIMSASRSVLYADAPNGDFAAAARHAARHLHDRIITARSDFWRIRQPQL